MQSLRVPCGAVSAARSLLSASCPPAWHAATFMVRAVHGLSKTWPKSYSFNSVFLDTVLFSLSLLCANQTLPTPDSPPLRIPSWAGRLLEAPFASSVSGVSARFRMVLDNRCPSLNIVQLTWRSEANRYCKVTGTKRVLTSRGRENSSLYCWKICAGWCSNWLDLNGLDVTP